MSLNEEQRSLRRLAEFLVGPAEIAEMLGVEANTINVWKVRHADFPAAVRRLKSGDIWDVREVRAWALATGRSPNAGNGTQMAHLPKDAPPG